MKAVGVVRKIDKLGRVAIPKAVRQTLGMGEGTPLEVFVTEEGNVVLRRYKGACALCGAGENLTTIQGLTLCRGCIGRFWSEVILERDGKPEEA